MAPKNGYMHIRAIRLVKLTLDWQFEANLILCSRVVFHKEPQKNVNFCLKQWHPNWTFFKSL
jgi:hypothetical protein